MSIDVARKDQLKQGAVTPGAVRKRAFETETTTVSQTQLAGGVVSGWHHHGERHLYGFVIAGRLRLEYGKQGIDYVEVERGDFFHIPPGLVHRDVNPEKQREVTAVSIVTGPGSSVINVNGPDN